MKDDEKLLNFKETMEYLNVSRNTVYRFMHDRRLIGYKVGIQWRFYLGDLRSFVNGYNVREKAGEVEGRIEHG